MDKKTVYFAHPMAHYDTDFEWECVRIIHQMLNTSEEQTPNIEIMNPNRKWLSSLYLNRKNSGDPDPFGIFREIVRGCDIIVGVSFFDGCIGAGVDEECLEGLRNGKKVFLISIKDGMKMFVPYHQAKGKVLTREETRQRKIDKVM